MSILKIVESSCSSLAYASRLSCWCLIFASVVFLGSSCRMPKFTAVQKEPPYVLTKAGQTVHADVVDVQLSKNGAKNLIAGFDAFPMKTVAAYSDGIATYHNIGDSQFAKKIVSGKLNLFTNNLNRFGKPGSFKPLNYFVQSGQRDDLSRMSYDVLKTMIPADASARSYLERYRKNDKLSYIIGGVALAITSAGIFQILSDKKGTAGLPQNPSGVVIAAVGIWGFISAAVLNEENKANLFHAVYEYNKN